jgi:four helix bundle protein
MTSEQLKARSKQFALAIIALIEKLPHTLAAQIIARQLVRSATSVGVNYRAACRARSRAGFAARVAIAVEEAGELVAILAASHKTASASRASRTRS